MPELNIGKIFHIQHLSFDFRLIEKLFLPAEYQCKTHVYPSVEISQQLFHAIKGQPKEILIFN